MSEEFLKTMSLTRKARTEKFGIDVQSGLVWKNWTIGGEYDRKLTIRNASNEILNIKYVLPSTKFFYMKYPEIVKLSPGMARTFTVKFRPIKFEEYHDYVAIETKYGSFAVKVSAYLPKISIVTPTEIDFQYCPAKEVTTVPFVIANNGDMETSFRWEIHPPFTVEPRESTISPGQKQEALVSFAPSSAAAFNCSMVLVTKPGNRYETKLKAVSKFPFITLDVQKMDFKDVLTGRKVESYAQLHNQSEVRTSFRIKRVESDTQSPFAVSTTSGVLQPNQKIGLKITYAPASTGTYSNDNFLVTTPGGNRAFLNCSGTGVGPTIVLDQDTVDLGDVEFGKTSRAFITLRNESRVPAEYHLQNTNGSFRFDKPSGVVPALLTVTIRITFAPKTSINFYQRVFILIKNAKPLFLDLMGTCFGSSRRPRPLNPVHVQNYNKRVSLGLRLTNPQLVDAEWEKGSILEIDELPNYQQYFLQNDDPEDEAYFSTDFLNFGACSTLRPSGYKIVTITNRTHRKLLAVWDLANYHGTEPAEGAKISPFVVFPNEADIPAGRSVDFKVGFRPRFDGEYYSGTLACYCFPKSQRNFRLVESANLLPPLCLRARAVGHTFSDGQIHFLPKHVLSSPGLIFPSCVVGSRVCLTLSLRNDASTPLLFYFPEDKDPSRVFRVKPRAGKIPQKSIQLISFEFSPTAGERYSNTFTCMLNYSKPLSIPVLGHGQNAKIRLVKYAADLLPTKKQLAKPTKSETTLFFKPTSRGTCARNQITLVNLSRCDTAYSWEIPENYAGVVKVHPSTGVLRGNEKKLLTWTFTPRSLKHYSIPANCSCHLVSSGITREKLYRMALAKANKTNRSKSFLKKVDSMIADRQRLDSLDDNSLLTFSNRDLTMPQAAIGLTRAMTRATLIIRGECSVGAVSFLPKHLDLGRCLLNAPKRGYITLSNSAHCTVDYKLAFQEMLPKPRFVPPKFFAQICAPSEIPDYQKNGGFLGAKKALSLLGSFTVVVDRTCKNGEQGWTQALEAVAKIAPKAPMMRGITLIFCGNGLVSSTDVYNSINNRETIEEIFEAEAKKIEEAATHEEQELKRIEEGKLAPRPDDFEEKRKGPSAGLVAAIQSLFERFRKNRRRESVFMILGSLPEQKMRDLTQQEIVRITRRISQLPQAFSLTMAQVGTEPGLGEWLNTLDRDLVHMGAKADIVDVIAAPQLTGVGLSETLELCLKTDSSGYASGCTDWKSGDKSSRRKKKAIKGSTTKLLSTSSYADEEEEGENGGDGYLQFVDCTGGYRFCFDKPTGSLAPKTSKKIWFSFCTEIVATHRFHVRATLSAAKDKKGDPVSHTMPDKITCESIIAADGYYPKMLVRDAYMPNRTRDEAWGKLNLPRINKELMGPLSDEERALNAERVSTIFKSIDVAQRLKRFTLRFGPGARDSMPDIAYLELFNPGHFACDWQLHFPDESIVEAEHWATMQTTTRAELVRAAIVAKKVFTASQKSGTLLPGESVSIQLGYTHTFVGSHRLELVLQVKHGKWITLDLFGSTLAAFPPILAVPTHAQSHVFTPQPLGLTLPGKQTAAISEAHAMMAPIQTYKLQNDSENTLHYRVETANLEKLRRAAHGIQVLSLINPTGEIPPFSSAYLRFRFRPAEDRMYYVALPISCKESPGISDKIIFCGRGYHATLSPNKAASSPLNPPLIVGSSEDDSGGEIESKFKRADSKRLMPLTTTLRQQLQQPSVMERITDLMASTAVIDKCKFPVVPPVSASVKTLEQSGRFTISRIDCGVVPTFSKTPNFVMLENLSESAPLFFVWRSLPTKGQKPDDLETISVEVLPRAGRVGAGMALPLRVSLSSGHTACEVAYEIECLLSHSQEELDAYVHGRGSGATSSSPMGSTQAAFAGMDMKGGDMGNRLNRIRGTTTVFGSESRAMYPEEDLEEHALITEGIAEHPQGYRPGQDLIRYNTSVQTVSLHLSASVRSAERILFEGRQKKRSKEALRANRKSGDKRTEGSKSSNAAIDEEKASLMPLPEALDGIDSDTESSPLDLHYRPVLDSVRQEPIEADSKDYKCGGDNETLNMLMDDCFPDPVFAKLLEKAPVEKIPTFRELEAKVERIQADPLAKTKAILTSNGGGDIPRVERGKIVQVEDWKATQKLLPQISPGATLDSRTAHELMEEFVFNLVSEAAFSDFDPTKPAKQVVTEGLDIMSLPPSVPPSRMGRLTGRPSGRSNWSGSGRQSGRKSLGGY